jgi:DNA-binding response OmpR family regulator
MTKNIMIVDDSPEILSLYHSLFKRRGYGVIEALDSASALKMLDETSPDLFILDVMMPEINGIELCQRIRALPQHEHTPVIILSAFSDTGIIEQAFAAGANDYVLKPIDPRHLEARIRELLGITEG